MTWVQIIILLKDANSILIIGVIKNYKIIMNNDNKIIIIKIIIIKTATMNHKKSLHVLMISYF